MPEGYDPIHQVLINSLVNVYLPRWRDPALALAAGLLAWWALRWRRQRASRKP
jgi:hypothetical protein